MNRRQRRKQVLVVDPDPGALTRLRGMLDGLGYRGLGGRNVTEAGAIARGAKLSMALVASAAGRDIEGLVELLHKAAVPVVVLYASEETRPALPGATGYLATPVRTSDLISTLYRYAGAPE